ncbi:hypothetical protein NOCARDAX2BIS_140132 [Nocardioides sp. AX2bis]|nr:hypothetical protein NOCARDAX2BIS_140132 [Nocardioides sp. AX2bis]
MTGAGTLVPDRGGRRNCRDLPARGALLLGAEVPEHYHYNRRDRDHGGRCGFLEVATGFVQRVAPMRLEDPDGGRDSGGVSQRLRGLLRCLEAAGREVCVAHRATGQCTQD